MNRLLVRGRVMRSHDGCTSWTSRILTVASLQRFEDGGSYSTARRLWNVVCFTLFECTEHSADRNSSSAVPDLCPHTARRSTHLLQEFGWEVFNHPPYSRTSRPVISIFSYNSRNSSSVSVRGFTMTGGDQLLQWLEFQVADFYDTDTKCGPTVWQMSQLRR